MIGSKSTFEASNGRLSAVTQPAVAATTERESSPTSHDSGSEGDYGSEREDSGDPSHSRADDTALPGSDGQGAAGHQLDNLLNAPTLLRDAAQQIATESSRSSIRAPDSPGLRGTLDVKLGDNGGTSPEPRAAAAVGAALSLPDGGEYVGDVVDGVPHGRGACTWEDGSEYEGQWRGGVRHGRGRMRLPDGGIYTGQFVAGIQAGAGSLSLHTGFYYHGDFADGSMTGNGCGQWPDGWQWRGQWKDSEPCGEGTMTSPDGTVTTGDYRGDAFVGSCVKRWANGAVYRGPLVGGHPEGRGTMSFPDGVMRYEGDFVDGQLSGTGSLHWLVKEHSVEGVPMDTTSVQRDWPHCASADASNLLAHELSAPEIAGSDASRVVFAVFDGDFRENVWSGRGRIRWPNGDEYVGTFGSDEGLGPEGPPATGYNGDGTYTWHAAKRSLSGRWSCGEPPLVGHLQIDEASTYDGEVDGAVRSGKGRHCAIVRTTESGEAPTSAFTVEAEWRDDRPVGHATVLWSNGAAYVGEMRHGRPHGSGVFVGPSVSSHTALPMRLVGRWAGGRCTTKLVWHGDGPGRQDESSGVLATPGSAEAARLFDFMSDLWSIT